MAFLTQAANRGSVSTGYDIDNSLKLEPDNSEFLSITNTSEGSKRTATYSFWLKRTELDASSYMQVAGLYNSGETVRFMFYQDHIMLENGWGGTRKRLTTNAVYRDTSAFYHFVVAIDTTQSTASNRVKLYVNGVQETSFSTEEYPDQNFDLAIGRSGANFPWRYGAYDATYYKIAGYLAEAHYIDGTQYAASDFGEFDPASGIWRPIEFTGNYGTQGSYLNFSDASNLGANPKGSDIDAVLNNITSADQATDTPTNNFCTLNLQVPNYVNTGGATEGGTKIPYSGVNHFGAWYGTQGFTKGKWYWEAYIPSRSSTYGLTNEMGVHTMENIVNGSPYYANAFKTSYYLNFHYGYTYAWDNGTKGSKNSEDGVPGFGTSQVGSWVGLAFNADDGKATWYLDGSQTGNANLDIYDLHDKMQDGIFGVPFFQVYHNNLNVNFGGYSSQAISSAETDENGYGSFEYAPPSGYYALCTKNLAEYG